MLGEEWTVSREQYGKEGGKKQGEERASKERKGRYKIELGEMNEHSEVGKDLEGRRNNR